MTWHWTLQESKLEVNKNQHINSGTQAGTQTLDLEQAMSLKRA